MGNVCSNSVLACTAFDHRLHDETFGQDSQFRANKLRHEAIKRKIESSGASPVLEENECVSPLNAPNNMPGLGGLLNTHGVSLTIEEVPDDPSHNPGPRFSIPIVAVRKQ